ncbi:hypothetical protein OEB96_20795 [Paraliomyxa miuraensis]|nr:hypothetical protein [Paraliomyxa miuraensis]
MARPKLSLTLVLSRQPSIDEPSITALVTQGMLAFTATLALPGAATAEGLHGSMRPLFVRAARFSLWYEGAELQHVEAFGPGATAAVSVMLGREAALSVLEAIRGGPTGLRLRCAIEHAVGVASPGGSGQAVLEIAAGLDELFRGCLEGQDSSAFIHLVGPDAGGVLAPVPMRVVQRPARGARPVRAQGATSLARVGTSVLALSAAARPNAMTAVDAHTLLMDATVQPTRIDSSWIHHWALDDLVIATQTDAPLAERSLPVVDDPAAPLWTDRIDASLWWYAPVFLVEAPAPDIGADASSFLFSFRTVGHTMSGAPGFEARIRFRLRSRMSDETRSAWEGAGKPSARPVELGSLSVALAVPFRDQTGSTLTEAFPATVTTEGDTIVAEVSLLDDWVRLAYGALSTPGFQNRPATLSVAYTYEAYVPLSDSNLELSFELKQALTPVSMVQARGGVPPGSAYLDARGLSYRTPHEVLRFTRERDGAQSIDTRIAAPMFAIRPELTQSIALPEFVGRWRYGIQRLGRDASQTTLVPCATLGSLYVQEDTDAGSVAIGCRDALQLGQTEYRQYLRIDALDDPEFSVWRSLQQPGRFLLVPVRWSIARFGADDVERAYRPSILVYSTLDPDVPENNRCAVLASLIPDISPSKRRGLMRSLASLAREPIVTLINEIDAVFEYAWSLPSSLGIDVRVVRLFDSFQVTLGTGLDAMPQLQAMLQTSGVTGSVRYRLPDGSALECVLALDLNRVVGPAPGGPVEVELQSMRATLTNRIERAVNVSDLVVESADARIETVRVEQRLDAAASLEVSIPAGVVHATPVITMAPGDATTLTEIRSFVEDIHTNVAFVNLVNHANHGLATMSLQARLRGADHVQELVLLESTPVAALDFVLPLTIYLGSPVLEFAVTKTMTDGTTATTAWLPWPLVERGNVVSLTWALIR